MFLIVLHMEESSQQHCEQSEAFLIPPQQEESKGHLTSHCGLID